MEHRQSAFIASDVIDRWITETQPSEVAAFYNQTWPANPSGSEVRIDCPIDDCEPSSYGKLAVSVADPATKIFCHSCGVRGNILTLMWIMKHRKPPSGARLRGSEFKEVVQDLRQLREGQSPPPHPSLPPPRTEAPDEERPAPNVPLRLSDNARTRDLVRLDEQGILDQAEMPPTAARYFRERSWLTEELCRKWGVTYLPLSTKGTLRGRIIFPVESVSGERLAWVGRDPGYEEKHADWIRKGKPEGKEPIKYRFPQEKFFRRGLELFGQQARRLGEPGYRGVIAEVGLIVVEGFTDVIRLDAEGVPAVAAMSNRLTNWQVEKLVQFAKLHANGRIAVLFDRDAPGADGAKEAMYELGKCGPVINAWGRDETGTVQPEGITSKACEALCESIAARW